MDRETLRSAVAKHLGIGDTDVIFSDEKQDPDQWVKILTEKVDDYSELVWLEHHEFTGPDGDSLALHAEYHSTDHPATRLGAVLTSQAHAATVATRACITCFPDDPSNDQWVEEYLPGGARLVRPRVPEEE